MITNFERQINMNRKMAAALCLLILFVIWTAAVSLIDVSPIGPLDSTVGFASMNGAFHDLTGVNMTLYDITDVLGLIPILIALGFGVFGLVQLIKRKSLFRVDSDIIALGVFFVAVAAVFLFFEVFVINYRPVLIEGELEASYPSSTTMLVLAVMPAVMIQFGRRIKNRSLRITVLALCTVFTVFTVLARIISGVHWISDIIGGMLVAAGLVLLYDAVCGILARKKGKH